MENEKITLSIIIPCYNCAETICECVESVVNEAIANNLSYEIIAVDDGSSDNTLLILNKLAFENKNIKVISQSNSGPSVARNVGLKLASGDFIALNDADDKWLPGKLKVQLEYLHQNPDIDLLCAKYGNCRRTEIKQEITLKKEVFHNYFSPQTSIFRKKVLVCGNIYFSENQKYSEDMKFIIDVMQHYKCMYIPILSTVPVISKCVFGESGLSSHIWKMEKGEVKNIYHVFKINQISFFYMIIAIAWSLIKYFRRIIIFALIRIKKIKYMKNNKKENVE